MFKPKLKTVLPDTETVASPSEASATTTTLETAGATVTAKSVKLTAEPATDTLNKPVLLERATRTWNS